MNISSLNIAIFLLILIVEKEYTFVERLIFSANVCLISGNSSIPDARGENPKQEKKGKNK